MAATIHYYNLANYQSLPQLADLPQEDREAIAVISHVFPFKISNYAAEHLIDWHAGPADPLFRMSIPHRGMLNRQDYQTIRDLLHRQASPIEISTAAQAIRQRLNPFPASQLTKNVPSLNGRQLLGIQHKYAETLLFFPSQGQNCHTWCTFCFRWPQFTNKKSHKFSSNQTEDLCQYLRLNPQITDILFTGGDPMTMSANRLAHYLEPLLQPEFAHVVNIRIGSKAAVWWPHRFLSDPDSQDLLNLFTKVKTAGRQLTFITHSTHPRELTAPLTAQALAAIQSTGAIIRAQGALLKGINNSPEVIAEKWRLETKLGCIPYYLFVERDTGPKDWFAVPLIEAWSIYRQANAQVSGLSKTVRGPVMSCTPGKIQILGPALNNQALALIYLQARRAELIGRPFLAAMDKQAVWWDELRPYSAADQEFFN